MSLKGELFVIKLGENLKDKKSCSGKIKRVIDILCNTEVPIKTYDHIYFNRERYNHCFIGREVINWSLENCPKLFEEYKKPKSRESNKKEQSSEKSERNVESFQLNGPHENEKVCQFEVEHSEPLAPSEEEDEIDKLLKENQHKFCLKSLQFKKKKLINQIIQKYLHLSSHNYSLDEEEGGECTFSTESIKKRIKILQLFNILLHLKVITPVDKTFDHHFVPSSTSFYYFHHLKEPLEFHNKLVSLVEMIKRELSIKDHKIRLILYKDCFSANELLDWIKQNIPHCQKVQDAVNFGRLLEFHDLLIHVKLKHHFKEGRRLFKFSSRIIQSGFLHFKEKPNDNLEERWVTLREDGTMQIYNGITNHFPTRILTLVNFSVSNLPTFETCTMTMNENPLSRELFHFYIISPNLVHFFATNSERERERWIHQLQPLSPELLKENDIINQIESQILTL